MKNRKKKLNDRQEVILHLLRLYPNGLTSLQIHDALVAENRISTNIARDISEIREVLGWGREQIPSEYVGRSSTGAMVYKWKFVEKGVAAA